MTTCVLVIDDDPAIRRVVATGLTARGYGVIEAATAADGLGAAAVDAPDLILLDLGLPDGDGVEVCRRIREFSTSPVIVLSVETTDRRKIEALDAGADDFLVKPFSMPELLARMRASLRRIPVGPTDPVLRLGDLAIDRAAHRVSVGGESVELTDTEYRILLVLAEHAGRLLTHDALLLRVWGPGYDRELHYLRVYINRLRRKVPFGPGSGRSLITVPRAGYRLDLEESGGH
ncbi:MAG: response regulator transcription factor [Actinobacteria bacterium]|jgi:two-component system KDP operon response regulator KdpE|nr:response regulator transcription factor [Actinomycetota bacterium]